MPTDRLQTAHRRRFLQAALATTAGGLVAPASERRVAAADVPPVARIALTLDLEMSAQYPRRDQTEWNFEKGNLDDATKRYSVAAAKLVTERRGKIHFFCVGRVLEQPDVGWLTEIARLGHPIGNHTYDHVNVKAFRTNSWKLEWFLRALRGAVAWAIETGGVFDFLAHPSCLLVEDPEMASLKLICDLVERAGPRARLVGLDEIAAHVR
jgi:hypothetical protein